MTSITKIANSQISRSTARIQTASFNQGLYLAEADSNLDAEDFYSVGEPDDVLLISGITTTSPVYLAAAAYFSGSITPETLIIGQKLVGDADHGASVARIKAAGAQFYFVGSESRVFAEQQTVSTYVGSQRMAYFPVSILTADLVAANTSSAETVNSDRSLFFYETAAANTYNEMRAMGKFAASTIGSWAAANQLISGAVDGKLTDAQYDDAILNRINFFANFGGNVVLQDGQTSSGEWLDVIVNLDYVDARLEESLALLKIARDKIGYDDDGIALEETAIRKVLGDAVDLGIFSSYTLTSKTANEVGAQVRGTRKYEGFKWTAQLEGAIQYTSVQGNVGA
jgi:hypothetical protein